MVTRDAQALLACLQCRMREDAQFAHALHKLFGVVALVDATRLRLEPVIAQFDRPGPPPRPTPARRPPAAHRQPSHQTPLLMAAELVQVRASSFDPHASKRGMSFPARNRLLARWPWDAVFVCISRLAADYAGYTHRQYYRRSAKVPAHFARETEGTFSIVCAHYSSLDDESKWKNHSYCRIFNEPSRYTRLRAVPLAATLTPSHFPCRLCHRRPLQRLWKTPASESVCPCPTL